MASTTNYEGQKATHPPPTESEATESELGENTEVTYGPYDELEEDRKRPMLPTTDYQKTESDHSNPTTN